MKITADTNVLVRLVMADDETQSSIAIETLESAELVAISTHSLCELVWLLARNYAVPCNEIAGMIRSLIEARNVVVDHPAVEAGLRMLDGGGDFADGVIAHDGNWLGGETFVSFDRKAVSLIAGQGQHQVRLLAPVR